MPALDSLEQCAQAPNIASVRTPTYFYFLGFSTLHYAANLITP
jgi:hypothetical protein